MRGSTNKGFTFVEVLASVLILTGVIIPFIRYAAENLRVSMNIERRVKSALLAEMEMEKIKNVLRKSFETDITTWPGNLGNNYLAGRTSTNVSTTLRIIEVSVGYDADSNGSLATDEVMVTLTTQYAKRD
jgi:Tfp pilus assembly protein PilV